MNLERRTEFQTGSAKLRKKNHATSVEDLDCVTRNLYRKEKCLIPSYRARIGKGQVCRNQRNRHDKALILEFHKLCKLHFFTNYKIRERYHH